MHCPLCEREFLSQDQLESHIDVSHCPRLSHRCQSCNQRFSSKVLVGQHQSEEHAPAFLEGSEPMDLSSASKIIKGGESSQSLPHDLSLEAADIGPDTMEPSSQSGEIKCYSEKATKNKVTKEVNVCDKLVSGTKELTTVEFKSEETEDNSDLVLNSTNKQQEQHSTHLKDEQVDLHDDLFQCNVCDFKTRLKSSLCTHLRKAHKVKPFECQQCGMSFGQKCHLLRHQKCHNSSLPLTCDKCPYRCKWKHDLKRHEMRKHKVKRRPFQCVQCGTAFSEKHHLVAHQQCHGDSPFRCDRCPFRANRKHYLARHRTRKHDLGGPRLMCHACDYTNTNKSNLENHVKTKHDGVIEFKCDECEYGTNLRGNLERHMAARHRGVKENRCSECGYATMQAVNLKKHLRTHHAK